MPTTAKGLRYPASSSAPNVPQDIQNLANDVDGLLSTTWTEDARSSSAISVVATAWATIFGPYSVTVPNGRRLHVEFSAPLIDVPAGTGLQGRIFIGGTAEDAKYWSNSGTTSIGFGGFMSGSHLGTGTSVSFTVDVQKIGASTPAVSAASIGYIIVRHRIV